MRHAKQSTNILAALSMLTVVCLACLPSPARAAYTRPLQGQITETPAGPLAVSESSGLATDAAGDLWVGNGSAVSEFDSAAAFVGTFGVDAKTTSRSMARSWDPICMSCRVNRAGRSL